MPTESVPISVPLECRYLWEPTPGEWTFVALHGYGQTAEEMLRLTRQMVGEAGLIASVQGPHPFTLRPFTQDPAAGYNWGVPGLGWEASIALHHRIVSSVLDSLAGRMGLRTERTILVGFSQPVGLNYRFVEAFPGRVRGVIGICGGVPKAWDDAVLRPIDAALLHISRAEDEFYPVERATRFPEVLRRAAADVEFHLIPGKHRFPSGARSIAEPWLARLTL
jgi:predicted esterase